MHYFKDAARYVLCCTCRLIIMCMIQIIRLWTDTNLERRGYAWLPAGVRCPKGQKAVTRWSLLN